MDVNDTGFSIEEYTEHDEGGDRGGHVHTLEVVVFTAGKTTHRFSISAPNGSCDGWHEEFEPLIASQADVIKVLKKELVKLEKDTEKIKNLLALAAKNENGQFETDFEPDTEDEDEDEDE